MHCPAWRVARRKALVGVVIRIGCLCRCRLAVGGVKLRLRVWAGAANLRGWRRDENRGELLNHVWLHQQGLLGDFGSVPQILAAEPVYVQRQCAHVLEVLCAVRVSGVALKVFHAIILPQAIFHLFQFGFPSRLHVHEGPARRKDTIHLSVLKRRILHGGRNFVCEPCIYYLAVLAARQRRSLHFHRRFPHGHSKPNRVEFFQKLGCHRLRLQ
mmetsp:Transcript_85739/g.239732  ORF Transcript_85739/g.239732 Transcript_85739/m.239732 type:complete len:213 (+) Transcript_85739:240-878(+)